MMLPGPANITEREVGLEKQFERFTSTPTPLWPKNPASLVKDLLWIEDPGGILTRFRARKPSIVSGLKSDDFSISKLPMNLQLRTSDEIQYSATQFSVWDKGRREDSHQALDATIEYLSVWHDKEDTPLLITSSLPAEEGIPHHAIYS
jgi:hypothetical protein